MALTVGTRVRTIIDLTPVDWAPAQPGIPAGALGTIDYIHYHHAFPDRITGYGVMLDETVDRLAVSMDASEIEAL